MSTDLIRAEHLPSTGPSRRRVLFITNMWPDEKRPYYGSFIASQARSLSAAGISVDVLYARGFLGVHTYLKALIDLPRAAQRRSYDVIHVHYGHTALASIGIRQRPLVISFCGEDLLGAPRQRGVTAKSRVEVAVFRQVARTATVTITKSKEMERVLPADLQEHNYVLPNGVDLDMFAPVPRDQARAELGWGLDEKVMLFLGNPDDPRKNVSLAREATEIVRREHPTARLHIAWGVSPGEVPSLMNAADCLAFTSRSEGSPNAIKEAMACTLPIVATPVGDIPERLSGVENCYVREPSPEQFAQALLRALTGDRTSEARAAVESLGIGVVADRLMEIYDAATERHLGRGGRRHGLSGVDVPSPAAACVDSMAGRRTEQTNREGNSV
jgi:teichuronic acid biosynthesis glycosyltransferase TuaC